MQRVVKIRGILGGTTEGAKTLHNRLIVNDCQPSFSGNHATFPPQSRDTLMVKYTYKFTLRKDHLLADGTHALVLQAFLHSLLTNVVLNQ